MQKTSPKPLFSPTRTEAIAARATRILKPGSDFLIQLAGETLADRLLVTNRQFADCVDLFSPFDVMVPLLLNSTNVGNITQIMFQSASTHVNRACIAASLDHLPLKPESVSLVTSLFSLHRCNNLPATLFHIRNALRPDGLFMAAMPGDRTLRELRECLLIAESELCGTASLRVEPFGEVRQYGSLLQNAGFALPVVDTELITVRYSSLGDLVSDLRAMGATSALDAKNPLPPRDLFERAGEIYAEKFSDEDGKIRATAEIVFLSGWAPDASQQKPLKPGSAKNQLKDFL